MSVPVIIAARNESQHIGETLGVLSRQAYSVEPIVVVNGCTDTTADIARMAGAQVLESDKGKVLAIQAGLRHLGKRALEPLLILDADSEPLSKQWSRQLVRGVEALPEEHPAIDWGPYVFNGEINPLAGGFFTATSMYVSWADRHETDPRTIRGGNTGLRLQTSQALEQVLALDNYWPREDVAFFDTIMENDGNNSVVMHPQAWVKTSGFRINDMLKKIIKERRHPSRITDDSYASEAPAGSKPYNSSRTKHQNKNPDVN